MKLRMYLTGVFCFLIGFFIVVQNEVIDGQRVFVSARSVEQVRISIESEKSEIENIKNMISDAAEQLVRYERARDDGDFSEILEDLAQEVLLYRMFSGYETVRGSGVRITVDDGTRPLRDWEDINVLLVHDIDIKIIVNDLKRNGAEAIAVNGQRIVDRTEISCAGYTVRINGQISARPFVINAIGDRARMSASLLSPEGYGMLLRDFGVQFEVELLGDMIIQGHTDMANYRYMVSTSSLLQ